jgi:hypothetical protein
VSDTLEESVPAHAPLGPSSSEGWSTCADYVNANRGLPDFQTEPAAEGTAAHAISDICLSLGLDAADFLGIVTRIGEYIFAWEEDDAMLLQHGIDKLRAASGNATFYGEQRVDISSWTLPGQFGTLDRAYITFDTVTEEWWIVIEDLKWGRGIAVSPIRCKQIMLYALGFWQQVGRHQIPEGVKPRFRLIIDQPRHAGGGGVWETTHDDLLAFGEWIKGRAVATQQPNPARTASLHGCIWCRRRRAPGGCDTFDAYMIALLGLTWDDIDMAMLMSEGIQLPRDQLDEECKADALAGLPTGDVKAVPGNLTPSTWVDKGITAKPVIERLLGDRGFTKKLKTPKQVTTELTDHEEALKELAPFMKPGRRPPVLVPLADARAPISVAQAKFDEEPEAETGD